MGEQGSLGICLSSNESAFYVCDGRKPQQFFDCQMLEAWNVMAGYVILGKQGSRTSWCGRFTRGGASDIHNRNVILGI